MEIKGIVRISIFIFGKLNSPTKSDFNFRFFGIEVGTNPFILDGLGMAQAKPFILELDEVCSIVYF